MGIPLGSSFTRTSAVPLDDSLKVADSTARDAIASGVRYEGMIVYVVADGQHYALIGGITNSDWGPIAGGGGASVDLGFDSFSGDNSQDTFTLSVDPVTINNTWVFISGVFQQKDSYSLSSGDIIFSEPPPIGTGNIEVMYTTPVSIGVPGNGTVTTAKLADEAVTTAKLDDGAVTNAKKGTPNFVEGSVINSSITSTTDADFTNNTLSFTTTGRMLEYGFKANQGDSDTARADISATGSVDTMRAIFTFLETTGNTILGVHQLGMRGHTTNSNWVFYGSASSIRGFAQLAAGTYTIKCQVRVATNNNLALTDCRMFVREI